MHGAAVIEPVMVGHHWRVGVAMPYDTEECRRTIGLNFWGEHMKICRFDDDRLGVVVGGLVHDVSAVQDEILGGSRYAMKGDAVIAALPGWRPRLEEMARRSTGKPLASVKLLAPVAKPSKVMAAPVNYKKHIVEMQNRTDIVIKFLPNIGDAGIFLKANSSLAGPSEDSCPISESDHRTRGGNRTDYRKGGYGYLAGGSHESCCRILPRARYDLAGQRRPKF
jgi:hypothetical protein